MLLECMNDGDTITVCGLPYLQIVSLLSCKPKAFVLCDVDLVAT